MANVPIHTAAPPDARTAFLAALDVFDGMLDRVDADRWQAPSPCAGWTAGDVLRHVLGTMGKTVVLLEGGGYEPGPSDPAAVPGDAQIAWRELLPRAREMIRGAALDRPVGTPRGPQPLAQALAFPTADLTVHAWDIATATGRHLTLPGELLAHVAALGAQVPEDVLRNPRAFGPAKQAPAGADDTTVLMAWLGRDVGVGNSTGRNDLGDR